ncbi:glycoside hydrolase family 3 C-terminal domain-containing protein, partial [Streptomyces flavofungini]|uniref:glycoside hydrolase family 3 C-terminal domain-containing protein n=1 Tax=Streptomyces flavofungini TaxID=68200 RepID=UPI0034DE143B
HPAILVAGADPRSPSGTTGPPTTVLAEALNGLGFTATALSTGTSPDEETVQRAVAAARGVAAVVVATYNVATHTATARDNTQAANSALSAARDEPAAVRTAQAARFAAMPGGGAAARDRQADLVAALRATGVPVVALAIRNPYDVAQLPEVDAALASYCWTGAALRAAARVIAGHAVPGGRLPVPVRRADDPAQVLYPVGHGLTY